MINIVFTSRRRRIAYNFDKLRQIKEIYPWSSGFGTKYIGPATLPAAAGSPYITAYPWAGAGFGTKYSNAQ